MHTLENACATMVSKATIVQQIVGVKAMVIAKQITLANVNGVGDGQIQRTNV